MTNFEIEASARNMLDKYVKRGGIHKVWEKVMEGEHIKYRTVPSQNARFVGALTHATNGQCYIMTNDSITNEGRRNFTIAHELGHYALKHPMREGGHFCQGDAIIEEGNAVLQIEREANYFATCLLMPEAKIHKAFLAMLQRSHKVRRKNFLLVQGEGSSFGAWCGFRDDLMKRYGVSEEALRNRLRSLRLAEFNF